MGVVHTIGVGAFKGLVRTICRVDDAQLERVPERGPIILVLNHVNIMEIPLIYTHLQPRPYTGLVAAHRWDRFWTRWLVEQCGAIPLRRGQADVSALRLGMNALEEGKILAVAPEGTRSGDGLLRKGRPGVALLAVRSDAPIIPLAHFGSENYTRNLARFRRSDFHIAVGDPFRLKIPESQVTRQIRGQMTNEIMYRLAALLPPSYRGVYSDLAKATEDYIVPA
jgi:1-acyl-sn-glycerol-3-phosphate acyltransferase